MDIWVDILMPNLQDDHEVLMANCPKRRPWCREELAEGARELTAFMAETNPLNGSHRTKSLRMGSMCGKFHPYIAFASIMSRNGDKIRC